MHGENGKMKFKRSVSRAGIVLAVMLAAVGCRGKGGGRDSGASGPSAGEAVSSDGVAIHYQVQGSGRPALVFVHGWCCDGSFWDAQTVRFSRGHKVVTVDLAGCGKSGRGRRKWTIEAFGGDVAAVVKKLGLRDVVLVGHSMGGDVIVEAEHELGGCVRGLVAVDSFRSLKGLSAEQIKAFVGGFRSDFRGRMNGFVRSVFGPAAEPALVERVVERMSGAPQGPALASLEALQRWRGEKLAEALGRVRVPIAAINSDMRDTDVNGFESRFAGMKFRIMSGVGHFVMMEDAERFNGLLDEALKEMRR